MPGAQGREVAAARPPVIENARTTGFRLRPNQPETRLSRVDAQKPLDINADLRRQCEYDSIQAAVDDFGNNDGS